MSQSAGTSPIERQLLDQIDDIGRRITELEAEQAALRRLLAKVRFKGAVVKGVTRRNSFRRIAIENRIIEILGESGRYVSGSEVFRQIKMNNRSIKPSTFRSYLHRLKEKGLIESSVSRRGYWIIAKNQK